jgi:hypothetical protein
VPTGPSTPPSAGADPDGAFFSDRIPIPGKRIAVLLLFGEGPWPCLKHEIIMIKRSLVCATASSRGAAIRSRALKCCAPLPTQRDRVIGGKSYYVRQTVEGLRSYGTYNMSLTTPMHGSLCDARPALLSYSAQTSIHHGNGRLYSSHGDGHQL